MSAALKVSRPHLTLQHSGGIGIKWEWSETYRIHFTLREKLHLVFVEEERPTDVDFFGADKI